MTLSLRSEPERPLTLVNSMIRWSIVARTYLHGDRLNALLSPQAVLPFGSRLPPLYLSPIPFVQCDTRPASLVPYRPYGGCVQCMHGLESLQLVRWRRAAFPMRGPSRIYALVGTRPYDCLVPVFGRCAVPCTCSLSSSPVASTPSRKTRVQGRRV